MIELAATLGWLDESQQRAETMALMNSLLSSRALGFAEVDLVCALNKDGTLDGQLGRLAISAESATAAQSAVLACLGSAEARAGILRALASRDDADVRVAQAYLRHRPISAKEELRRVVNDVSRMQGRAQVRALDTLARLHISDRDILEQLSRAFVEAKTVDVQRAIAEVFIRSDPKALPRPGLAAMLRQHRLKPAGASHDLIDTLLARLQAG
jgi:hypothetical protein